MADHLHKQIRVALVAALTGLTTTTTHVYANRLHALADSNLPALRIFDDSEEAQGITIHQPQAQERSYEVIVECCAKEAGDSDATNDQASKEVETALAAGITVAGRSLEVFYRGMQRDREQIDKPVAIKRLRFSIIYSAMSNAPDVLT